MVRESEYHSFVKTPKKPFRRRQLRLDSVENSETPKLIHLIEECDLEIGECGGRNNLELGVRHLYPGHVMSIEKKLAECSWLRQGCTELVADLQERSHGSMSRFYVKENAKEAGPPTGTEAVCWFSKREAGRRATSC